MTIHFGTFLLMQSPSGRPSQEMYARAIEIAQTAEALGFHHPLVVAEEIATLDQLAGGRVDIGLGRGYQHYEFERLGLELDSARGRWEESVDVILKAFRGEPFSYDGKLFRIPETSVFPHPVQ